MTARYLVLTDHGYISRPGLSLEKSSAWSLGKDVFIVYTCDLIFIKIYNMCVCGSTKKVLFVNDAKKTAPYSYLRGC